MMDRAIERLKWNAKESMDGSCNLTIYETVFSCWLIFRFFFLLWIASCFACNTTYNVLGQCLRKFNSHWERLSCSQTSILYKTISFQFRGRLLHLYLLRLFQVNNEVRFAHSTIYCINLVTKRQMVGSTGRNTDTPVLDFWGVLVLLFFCKNILSFRFCGVCPR